MRLFIFLFTAALATLFSSCDSCRNLDCAASNLSGQFRIVSVATGQDLVFGASRVYDKDQIKFYSLDGTDTMHFDYKPIRFPGSGYDSILNVWFYVKTDVAYIRLGNGDVDTLNISYRTRDTRCCGFITDISQYRYNNTVDLPGDQGTVELRK